MEVVNMNIKEATTHYRTMWDAPLSPLREAQMVLMAAGYRAMAFQISDCIAIRKEINPYRRLPNPKQPSNIHRHQKDKLEYPT